MDILVADADRAVRELLDLLLAPLGSVRGVPDAAEAMRAVIAHEPDVLVTDIRLPVVTGLELIANIRAAPRWPPSKQPIARRSISRATATGLSTATQSASA